MGRAYQPAAPGVGDREDLVSEELPGSRMPVDYDDVLTHIGELGPWQKRLFALLWIPSATSAMAVFMYDFTAFVPAMRCLVPGCDSDETSYDAPFTNFSLPWDGEAVSECLRYKRTGTALDCSPGSFSKETETCTSWVYDHSLIESSGVEVAPPLSTSPGFRDAARL